MGWLYRGKTQQSLSVVLCEYKFMEELSSNNLIKIITHSHNHTNQLEGKHALLNMFSIVHGISKIGHIFI